MDIVKYFTHLTGLIPTEDQKAFLLDGIALDIHKLLISAGRQSGKTLCTAVVILWWVFESGRNVKVLLLSAQDNILYYHIREIFKKRPEMSKDIVAEGVYSIVPLKGFEATNGNNVIVKGVTDKQIRGIPADIVIIDECCEVKNESVETAMGNITGPISKLIVLSTPHVATSYFVEWATEKKGTFKVHIWSAEGLPWHNKSIEDEKKKKMSRARYAVEVLGRPPEESERAFFPSKHIEKCEGITEEDIREGGANSRVEIGIDFGGDTVLVVTERIGTTIRKILFVKEWKGKPIEMIGPEILEIIARYKPFVSKGDSKPPEYKQWFDRTARFRVKFIDFALGHKEQMFGQLQRMIREHRLIIPNGNPRLVIALKQYRYVKGEKAKSSKSDIVDALALSIYEPVVPLTGDIGGRVYFKEV
jgi:hypothetical protein